MATVLEADTPDRIAAARSLFEEYAAAIGVDLSFQGFDDELAALPGKYTLPGGGLFLAYCGSEPCGCVAVRPFEPPHISGRFSSAKSSWRSRGKRRRGGISRRP